MAFINLWSELVGTIPGLDPFLAQTYINRAWRDVRQSGRQWSFQMGEVSIPMPAQISAGVCSVTQFSQSIVPNAAAAAAINAAFNGTPPLLQQQFRANGTELYNITGWTAPAGPLTIDRPFQDATNANAPYQVYRAYYNAPVTDFVRWVSVVDPVNEYPLELDHTQQEVDFYDPGRQSQDQPYWVASHLVGPLLDDTTAVIFPSISFFELWPHPTVSGTLVGYYQREGADLVAPADTLPQPISDDLILARAFGWHAYPWAMANVGRFPQLKGSNWGFLMNDAKESYTGNPVKRRVGLLAQAKRQDDETFNRSRIFKRFRRLNRFGPIDSAFFQTHGVPPGAY